MNINVFLLCFNESVLLPHTIKHYKKYLPSCKITIYDNESTDNSVNIAKELGCSVVSWSSNNCIDDFKYREIKNNCWKSVERGWIIMADIDEFLCVTEDELMKEKNLGTSILNIIGYDMLGESESSDLSDIDLQKIQKYVDNHYESKNLCFLREKVKEMNYDIGAHNSKPEGDIKYSSKNYINKHMSSLGLKFLINKITERYKRAANMRKHGIARHYTTDVTKIETTYRNSINTCKVLENLNY
jgi:Glycosyl transferase family 2